MRDFIFRAKPLNADYWVHGDLVHGAQNQAGKVFIWSENDSPFPLDVFEFVVEPATVCQYTGLNDKNGKPIFEGDIIHYLYEPWKGFWNADQLSVIEYKSTGFYMKGIPGTNRYACMDGWLVSLPYTQCKYTKDVPEFEVVGNVFDNPELLEGANNTRI